MLNIGMPDTKDLSEMQPRITVVGVGGAGGNAVNNMIAAKLEGAEFVTANTDAQALMQSTAPRRIQLGAHLTQGLGAGAKPEVGRAAAEEAIEAVNEHLEGSNMVFITAGMGGGTGTGAAPVFAAAAREKGILTVGVVTKPFHFEGTRRMRLAEAGIAELQKVVDTLIVIPNQNLFRVANDKTTFAQAFSMADEVLHSGVRSITDLMVMPGLINLDFADVCTVMDEMGKAMMGAGEAEGEDRARMAAEAAISNPLLDDVSMKGARGVLINISGGDDLALYEVDEAANRIRDEVDPDANIIVGSVFNGNLDGRMRVSVVATGIDCEEDMNRPSVAAAAAMAEAERSGQRLHRGLPVNLAKAGENSTANIATPEPEAAQEALDHVLGTQQAASEPQVVELAQAPVVEAAPAATQPEMFATPEVAQPGPQEAFIAQAPAHPEVEPELATTRDAPAETRGPSLIERVAGRFRGGSDETQAAQAAAQAKPDLRVDPNERLDLSTGEDPQLRIPAFMRRQAN